MNTHPADLEVLPRPGRRGHGPGRVPAVGLQELHRARAPPGRMRLAPSARTSSSSTRRGSRWCAAPPATTARSSRICSPPSTTFSSTRPRATASCCRPTSTTRAATSRICSRCWSRSRKEIEARLKSGGEAARKAFAARVKSLVEDVPDLPNFSHFHDRFRDDPQGTTLEGDMRSAFYMAYDEDGCEHIKLMSPEIDKRLAVRTAAGLGQLRDPLSARLPDHGARAGDQGRHHRVHAQAGREGDPRLRRQAGAQADQPCRAQERAKLARSARRRRRRPRRPSASRRQPRRPAAHDDLAKRSNDHD